MAGVCPARPGRRSHPVYLSSEQNADLVSSGWLVVLRDPTMYGEKSTAEGGDPARSGPSGSDRCPQKRTGCSGKAYEVRGVFVPPAWAVRGRHEAGFPGGLTVVLVLC